MFWNVSRTSSYGWGLGVFNFPWLVLLLMQNRFTGCYNLKVLHFNKEVRRRNSLINQSIEKWSQIIFLLAMFGIWCQPWGLWMDTLSSEQLVLLPCLPLLLLKDNKSHSKGEADSSLGKWTLCWGVHGVSPPSTTKTVVVIVKLSISRHFWNCFGSCCSPVPLAEVIGIPDVHAFLEEWMKKSIILCKIPIWGGWDFNFSVLYAGSQAL